VVLLAIGVVALVFPYVRDDLVLDRVVRAVALDWRDYGEDRARGRLEYELDNRGIGLQVADNDCALKRQEADKVVRCAWSVEVEVPFLPWSVPLAFRSIATLGPTGDIR
jgi:hypothetical protein